MGTPSARHACLREQSIWPRRRQTHTLAVSGWSLARGLPYLCLPSRHSVCRRAFIALFRDKTVEESIATYTAAIEACPSDVPLYSNRAAAFCRLSDDEDAMIDARKALCLCSWQKIHPSEPMYRRVLGHSWALVGPLMYYLLINFIINKCIVRVRVLKNTHKRSYWFCVFVFLVSPAVVVYLSSIIMMLQYLHLVNTRRNVISSLRRHKNQKKTCSRVPSVLCSLSLCIKSPSAQCSFYNRRAVHSLHRLDD